LVAAPAFPKAASASGVRSAKSIRQIILNAMQSICESDQTGA
jgi:hypothetical protein